MQKYIKTGLLIVVLVVPVLVFLFLQGYTTNHFDLPYYVPLRNPGTNEVVIKNGDTAFYQIQGFSLPSFDKKSIVTAAVLQGKTTVINTLNEPCDEGCQKVLTQLTRIYALHQTYPSLALLTIVSGEGKPTKSIAARQKPGWLIVQESDSTNTGTLQNIFHLLPEGENRQTIPVYDQLMLVDGQGYIRGYYDARKTEEIERLLGEIRVLQYNKRTEQK